MYFTLLLVGIICGLNSVFGQQCWAPNSCGDPPVDGQYTSQICECGDDKANPPYELYQQTVVSDCAVADTFTADGADKTYVQVPCDPGNYNTLGSDTVIANCFDPGNTISDFYVSVACQAGTSSSAGSDTETTLCTTPGPNEYVVTPCQLGNIIKKGEDTVIAACTNIDLPDGEEYDYGTYVSEACISGNVTTAGSDTVISNCGDTRSNYYISAKCKMGSASAAGTPTMYEPCTAEPSVDDDDDTVTLTYLNAQCVYGSKDEVGSDTVVVECPASIRECTKDSCTLRADNLEGDSCNLKECQARCLIGLSTMQLLMLIIFLVCLVLCFAWCIYVAMIAPKAPKPIFIESATQPNLYIVAQFGTNIEGKMKKGLFVDEIEAPTSMNYQIEKNKILRECALFWEDGEHYRCNSTTPPLYWAKEDSGSILTSDHVTERLFLEKVEALDGTANAISFKIPASHAEGKNLYIRHMGVEEGNLQIVEIEDMDNIDQVVLDSSSWYIKDFGKGIFYEDELEVEEEVDDERILK